MLEKHKVGAAVVADMKKTNRGEVVIHVLLKMVAVFIFI